MKQLLDLPIIYVLDKLSILKVRQPITVEEGLRYLMFMQVISDDLENNGGSISDISLHRIVQLAKEHGGYVEQSWAGLTGQDMHMAIIQNNATELFFTRLAHYTATLLLVEKR